MESFWKDLYSEEVHIHDDLQFEINSDFAFIPNLDKNISFQEFYFFIPEALQVHPHTYTKEQFYKDRTNLIRYKTPKFSFKDLVDRNTFQSPLIRIEGMIHAKHTDENALFIDDELKLLGNVVRSSLRESVKGLINAFSDNKKNPENLVLAFCDDIVFFLKDYRLIQAQCRSNWDENISEVFSCVDEFISISIDYYITGFVEYLRKSPIENLSKLEQKLCEVIIEEQTYRDQHFREISSQKNSDLLPEEQVLYHKSLLSKYVLDVLLLKLERCAWTDKYGNIVAGVAAAIAMLVYVTMIFFKLQNMAFNSLSFLLASVILYVLKDRIKDGLKSLLMKQAVQYFWDYIIQIKNPSREKVLGKLKEIFGYMPERNLPPDIAILRKTVFDTDVSIFKRRDTILYYKKEMELNTEKEILKLRRHILHNVFLFNIRPIIEKAKNPVEFISKINKDTLEIAKEGLPKVYQLNMVIKTTYINKDSKKIETIKPIKIIVDKYGIKRCIVGSQIAS